MNTAKLFQYAILFHPTKKEIEEGGLKPKVVVDLKTILSETQESASMAAAMDIPSEYKDQLNQIQIAIRPF